MPTIKRVGKRDSFKEYRRKCLHKIFHRKKWTSKQTEIILYNLYLRSHLPSKVLKHFCKILVERKKNIFKK